MSGVASPIVPSDTGRKAASRFAAGSSTIALPSRTNSLRASVTRRREASARCLQSRAFGTAPGVALGRSSRLVGFCCGLCRSQGLRGLDPWQVVCLSTTELRVIRGSDTIQNCQQTDERRQSGQGCERYSLDTLSLCPRCFSEVKHRGADERCNRCDQVTSVGPGKEPREADQAHPQRRCNDASQIVGKVVAIERVLFTLVVSRGRG